MIRPTHRRRARTRLAAAGPASVAALAAAAAVLGAAAPAGAAPAAAHRTVAAKRAAAHLSARESSLIGSINAVRKARHLSLLKVDPRLTSSAKAWSATMARAQCIWHDIDRLQRLDDQTKMASLRETLAMVPTDVERTAAVTTQAWMNSSPHRADILAPGMHHAGVGIVAYNGDYYITLDIGS